MNKSDIIVIAIAGPSGSGKSSLAHALTEELDQHKCQMIELDNYYRALWAIFKIWCRKDYEWIIFSFWFKVYRATVPNINQIIRKE